MVEAGEQKGCCATGGGGSSGPAPSTHTSIQNRPGGSGKLPEPQMNEVYTAKIIFMGERSVGKTSIIKAFIDEEL